VARHRWLAPAAAVLLAACGGGSSGTPPAPQPSPSAAAEAARPPLCARELRVEEVGRVTAPAATELSGLARTRDGRFWAHNDSGDGPRLFELAPDGSLRREVTLLGAQAVDWEDIAIRGSTLYVADIGDNRAQRQDVTVYRLREPEPGATTASVERVVLTYPNGPRDAEALLIDPRNGSLAIVTKDYGGHSEVYTGVPLTHAATLSLGFGGAVTGGDVSADGRTIVLRTYDRAFVWTREPDEPLGEALKREPCVAGAGLLHEGQGEALALDRRGRAFYTVAEGAGAPLRRYGAATP
jgi:hypothetical protein